MSKVIIVGTLAFDSIETPYGNAVNILGGSAPYASLAALTKDVECAIISIIGNDFTLLPNTMLIGEIGLLIASLITIYTGYEYFKLHYKSF